MVKIEIKLEGETLQDIIKEISLLLESNKPLVKDILETLALQALDVLNEKKILRRGADLYVNITRNINWKYHKE
jgi:hypothetical protein